jgi:hypothetical protein
MKPRATRQELDAIGWRIMHEQKVNEGEPLGLKHCCRPANYRELGELIDSRQGNELAFELAWSEFLHEFCRYKSASFFAEEPPTTMSSGFRAWLAGVAEFMCLEFNLVPVPGWTEKPEFFLLEEFDPASELLPFYVPDGEALDRHRARCHPVFLRRNVLFEVRGLITV